MLLSRHSVGTYQETNSHATRQGDTRSQSSQIVEPLWTDPGLKSGISALVLISIKKKKSAVGDWIVEYSPQILAQEEKAPTPISIMLGGSGCAN